MSIQNCPSCGGTHFGSNVCPYDKQAEKLLTDAADFMAGNLPKPDPRAWSQLLIYCPLVEEMTWFPAEHAPKDGTHILVCSGPYSAGWGFDQSPPRVVHYFTDPDEPGFYPSHGIVQDSYNDAPVNFTHWRRLGEPPQVTGAVGSPVTHQNKGEHQS